MRKLQHLCRLLTVKTGSMYARFNVKQNLNIFFRSSPFMTALHPLTYLAVVVRLRPYRDAAKINGVLELDGNHERLHLVVSVSRQLIRTEVLALLRQRIEGSTDSVKEEQTCVLPKKHLARTPIDTYTTVVM